VCIDRCFSWSEHQVCSKITCIRKDKEHSSPIPKKNGNASLAKSMIFLKIKTWIIQYFYFNSIFIFILSLIIFHSIYAKFSLKVVQKMISFTYAFFMIGSFLNFVTFIFTCRASGFDPERWWLLTLHQRCKRILSQMSIDVSVGAITNLKKGLSKKYDFVVKSNLNGVRISSFCKRCKIWMTNFHVDVVDPEQSCPD